jgi:hypothetical protein
MFDGIPSGLDQMPPGPALGGFLASIDVEAVSPRDRVVVLRALQRQASHLQSQLHAAMASIAEHMETTEFPDDPALAWDAATAEIGAALRLTRRAAHTNLDISVAVHRRLPHVWAALRDGTIDPPRARVLADGTSHLDQPAARRVVALVIDDAPTLTTGQLAARLRRLCIQTDPAAAKDRYDHTVERRRVVLEASVDGTAHLCGWDLPPDRAAAVANRIDRIARSLPHDPRTLDQKRADVYLDLLTGAHHHTGGGIVELRVDLDTLTRLTDAPGEIAGYGPVVADIARQVTQAQTTGEWRYTITHPDTGRPLHHGTTRRRPTASQRRSVETRDRTCVFPGCRMPATQSDLDHRTPWARCHRTTARDLAPLCRYHHHTLRHRAGWIHEPLPDGDHLWTSPLGHHYTTSGRSP